MRYRFGIFLLLYSFLSTVYATVPEITLDVDIQFPERRYTLNTAAGNTPIVTVTLLQDGSTNTSLGAGWTPQLLYAKNDRSANLATITGTLDHTTGIITFTSLTNSFPVQGNFFTEIILLKSDDKITYGQGELRIRRSPGTGSYGNLKLITSYQLGYNC